MGIKRLIHRMCGADKGYYRAFYRIFGHTPENIELYKLALVHRSASVKVEGGESVNNERLEFLGDAVLESIVSDYLFIEYPHESEGFLTKTRSKIVSRQSLNALAQKLGLEGSIAVTHGLSCPMACAISPERGSNRVPRIGRWIPNTGP